MAEDAARAIAVMLAGVLSLLMIVIVLLTFIESLPGAFRVLLVLSLATLGVVVGRALLARILAIPRLYKVDPPRLRTRLRSSSG